MDKLVAVYEAARVLADESRVLDDGSTILVPKWALDGLETSLARAATLPILADDDDPACVCGVHRSEHALCGCADGFERAVQS